VNWGQDRWSLIYGKMSPAFPYDTTRTDLDVLERYLGAVVASGNGNRIRLVDTTGGILPRAIGFLIDRMRKKIGNLPIEVHCHNDFGLATATTLAAAEAGPDFLSTTMDGLGERAGNTPTEEIVVALRVLYGLDIGILLNRIEGVSLEIERMSKVRLQPQKSIVGRNAFSHESGLVAGRVLSNPFTGESVSPTLVGRIRKIQVGKKSGLATIEAKLEELGLNADVPKARKMLEKVKEASISKKSALSDSEFRKIVKEVLG